MTPESPGKGWRENSGAEPKTKKRVRVVLRNGLLTGDKPLSTTAPIGWDVRTTRWDLSGSPFDVIWWRPN